MKKSHIYTRTGDTGTTSLIGGSRIKKCHQRLEAYGTIDELNAHLGLLAAMLQSQEESQQLTWIQSRLFDAGTHLAIPCSEEGKAPVCHISDAHIAHIEAMIDNTDAKLEPLHSFILPGGSTEAAQCHICRTVCRRAERLIIALSEETPINSNLLSFINRLSDFLFVFARHLNKMKGTADFLWQKDGD